MNVPKVNYEIVYNGKNITGDILPHVLNFSYTDKSKGEADEIQIVMEDTAGLWANAWYPQKGDTVSARIIDINGTLDCGTFTVDEITGEGSGSGDTFTIKAIAASINKKIRTKRSYAHESKSLREIANSIAAKNGLTLQGSIKDVRISRITQYRESDLSFLQRLSFEYGYTFTIRDKKLIFTNIFELESKAAALNIHRNEVISFSITDKTANTFKSARVSYHNPKKKKVFTHTANETAEAYQGAKVDSLEIRIRAENQQQAEIKSQVALYRANSMQQEGTIEMPGNIYAVAGNNCTFEGVGMFSGTFYLDSTTHNVAKDGGYASSLTIKRIGLIEKKKHKRNS
jgi:phage protein D